MTIRSSGKADGGRYLKRNLEELRTQKYKEEAKLGGVEGVTGRV